nr:sugar ABC transporter ATP-binding protein [Afifella sp. IM 167]
MNKRFYGALALDNADFALRPGEIHALIGENGAGKSTLIKILAGVYTMDAGQIRVEGKLVDPIKEDLPIGFVHQDLAFADDLSVGENIALGAGYPLRGGLIDWRAVNDQARRIYDVMDEEPLDPNRLVATLSTSERAILGIVRTLANAPKVLVLDEPTAALPENDSNRLFAAMRQLKAAGTSIIYVSHRLNELFGLVDRVTVFRDGRRVHVTPIEETNPDRLVEQMLGRAVDLSHSNARPEAAKPPILSVEDLVVQRRGPVSFTVSPGEVVGLVGLRGGGQEAIGRAIFGAIEPDSGRIRLDGTELKPGRSIGDSIKAGVVLLAGDRTGESAFAGMSLIENLFVNPLLEKRAPWKPVSPASERKAVEKILEDFDVRPRNPDSLIDWLSGGNQQKVCIARWLKADAKVAILEEPTAGVDVGAKLAIYDLLREAAKEGLALIVISTDLEEVAAICDRALIVNRGRISSSLAGEDLTVHALIAHSSAGAAPAGTAMAEQHP